MPSLQHAAEHAADSIEQLISTMAEPVRQRTWRTGVDQLGWSVGAVIAQATAVVLENRGIPVRKLVLMDGYPAELWKDREAPTEQERLRGLLIMSGLDAPESQPGSEAVLTQASVVAAIKETGSPFASLPEDVLHGVMQMVEHNAQLMREHSSQRFYGAAHFFKATLNPDQLDESSWTAHLDHLEVVELHCTHPGMVHPESLGTISTALS